MKLRPAFAALILLVATTFSLADVGIGDARDDVLRRFGKPSSVARRGDHEIFLYPKGGRIELVAGKVTDVKGPLPPPLVAIPEAAANLAAATAAPAPGEPTSPPASTPAPSQLPATTASNHSGAPDKSSAAAHPLAQHVETMDTPWGASLPPETEPSPFESLPSFLTGLVLRMAFTILALKLAFKYWEMDAFWSGIFTIAGIDLVLHAGLEMLGPATGGFTTLSAVENGLPGLVLIYTVHRFCFNKRLQNAVVTAAAVKLVVTLCYIFAGVAMLNAIYA